MTKAETIRRYGIEEYERRLEQRRQWYAQNSDYIKEKDKRYHQTPRGRANNLKSAYNRNDKKKGFDISNNINPEWIVTNVFSGHKCIYCGESDWRKLGVDRVDNNKPHTPDNCVPACWDCNNARGDKYTVEEFIEYRKQHPKGQNVNPPLPKSRIKKLKLTSVYLI